MHIAYLIGCYPSITLTFIEREICALEEQGVSIDIVSMVPPPEGEILEEARWRIPHIFYTRPIRPMLLLRAMARFALTAPLGFWSTLAWLLTRPHPAPLSRLKTVLHFAQGVYVAEHLRGRGIDHLHAHFADRATVIALVVSRLLDVPFSFTAHAKDIYAEDVFLKSKIQEASFVITCSQANVRYMGRLSGVPEKIRCLYMGLPLEELTAHPLEPQTPPLVLAVGRLVEKKGFVYLLEACAILQRQGVPFSCVIVGEGPERSRLESLRTRLGLEERVSLPGSRPFAEVLRLMRRATVFVLPCVIARNADRDGIPVVLMEAMAVGVPVVSTPVSGVPELVHHEETGLLVPSRDAEALADALARLLEDEALRARLRERARQFVLLHFDVRRNVMALHSWFDDAVARRSPVLQRSPSFTSR